MVVHHVLLLWSTLAMGVDAINVNHAEEKSVSGVCTTRDGYLAWLSSSTQPMIFFRKKKIQVMVIWREASYARPYMHIRSQ